MPCPAAPPHWTAPPAALTPPAHLSKGNPCHPCRVEPEKHYCDGFSRQPPSMKPY